MLYWFIVIMIKFRYISILFNIGDSSIINPLLIIELNTLVSLNYNTL